MFEVAYGVVPTILLVGSIAWMVAVALNERSRVGWLLIVPSIVLFGIVFFSVISNVLEAMVFVSLLVFASLVLGLAWVLTKVPGQVWLALATIVMAISVVFFVLYVIDSGWTSQRYSTYQAKIDGATDSIRGKANSVIHGYVQFLYETSQDIGDVPELASTIIGGSEHVSACNVRVFNPKLDLYDSPNGKRIVYYPNYRGMALAIERENGWYKVEIGKTSGWALASDLENSPCLQELSD